MGNSTTAQLGNSLTEGTIVDRAGKGFLLIYPPSNWLITNVGFLSSAGCSLVIEKKDCGPASLFGQNRQNGGMVSDACLCSYSQLVDHFVVNGGRVAPYKKVRRLKVLPYHIAEKGNS